MTAPCRLVILSEVRSLGRPNGVEGPLYGEVFLQDRGSFDSPASAATDAGSLRMTKLDRNGTSERDKLRRTDYSIHRLNTRQPLVPPKPKEFDMA